MNTGVDFLADGYYGNHTKQVAKRAMYVGAKKRQQVFAPYCLIGKTNAHADFATRHNQLPSTYP